MDEQYADLAKRIRCRKRGQAARSNFQKLDRKLQDRFGKFFYKQKVIEEMALVAENIHDKFQSSLEAINEARSTAQIRPTNSVIEVGAKKNPGARRICAHVLHRIFSQPACS